MSAAQTSEPAVLIAIAVFGVAIVGIALLLLLSARAANTHLTNATKLSGPVLTQLADAAKRRDGAPPSGTDAQRGFAASARTADDDADASHQIFAQLNEYYAANIIAGNTIFWASLLSMIVGFAFITFAIFKAGASSTTAIVAGVAGIFSQFIGATFLVALRSTQEQSTTYAQTLVQLRMRDVRAAADARSVNLGLALLNEISADGAEALANQTRAAIAMGLIVKNGPPPTAPETQIAPEPLDAAAAEPKARTRGGVITFDTEDSTSAATLPDRESKIASRPDA